MYEFKISYFFYSEYDESLDDGDNVSSDSGLQSSAIFSLDLAWASFLGLFLIMEKKNQYHLHWKDALLSVKVKSKTNGLIKYALQILLNGFNKIPILISLCIKTSTFFQTDQPTWHI